MLKMGTNKVGKLKIQACPRAVVVAHSQLGPHNYTSEGTMLSKLTSPKNIGLLGQLSIFRVNVTSYRLGKHTVCQPHQGEGVSGL